MAIPVFQSAYVNGSNAYEVVLSYDGQLDDTSVPTPSDFTISGGGRTVTRVLITSSAYDPSWVMLEINDTRQAGWIDYNESVTVGYTSGGTPLKNADGNCANLTTETITNNVKSAVPVIEYVSVNTLNPKLWTVILNRPCVVTSTGWTPKINGTPATVNNLNGYGTGTLFFETEESVDSHTDTLTIDYDSGVGMIASVNNMYPIEGILYMTSVTGRHVINNIPNPTPDYILELGDTWKPDMSHVLPGETIGVRGGQRGNTGIGLLSGTIDAPIKVVNIGGVALCGTNPTVSTGINFFDCQHVHVNGNTDSEEPYGFQLIGYTGLEVNNKSSNFEINGVKILESGYAGIVHRSNVGCTGTNSKFNLVQENTHIHDCLVTNAGGEGMYIGASHWGNGQTAQPGCVGTLLWESELKGFTRIYNIAVKNSGLDGIQVGGAVEDCEIFNNTIDSYGENMDGGHMSGIQVNPGTQGLIYNNWIADGTNGWGIFVTGGGYNTIYNNIIVRGAGAFFLSDNGVPVLGSWARMHNNTMVDMAGEFCSMYASIMEEVDFKNNIMAGSDGNYFVNKNGTAEWTESNNLKTQVIADVVFVDEVTDNYNLDTGSPALNNAVDLSDYGIYSIDQGALSVQNYPSVLPDTLGLKTLLNL